MPGEASSGTVAIYLGGASGVSTTPAIVLTGPDAPNDLFGAGLASLGDVNGDGYADLGVGAPEVMGDTGRVYVFLGSGSGLTATPATTLTGPDGPTGGFGFSVASAGDFDADGYDDLLVGAPSKGSGHAYVFRGGAAGIAATPALTLGQQTMTETTIGSAVQGAVYLDGDGRSDLAVGADDDVGIFGVEHVYLNSAGGLGATPVVLSSPPNTFGFGTALAAGDVNADGIDDLVVVSGQNGATLGVYPGTTSGPPATGEPYPRRARQLSRLVRVLRGRRGGYERRRVCRSGRGWTGHPDDQRDGHGADPGGRLLLCRQPLRAVGGALLHDRGASVRGQLRKLRLLSPPSGRVGWADPPRQQSGSNLRFERTRFLGGPRGTILAGAAP